MRTFEVWTEGFAVTGQSSQAHFWGSYPGDTFKEAVESAIKNQYSQKDIERNYSPTKLTWWGCGFFDNEEEARKSFG